MHLFSKLPIFQIFPLSCTKPPVFPHTDGFILGPSAMEANLYGAPVREMDESMMDMIADAYANAAFTAQYAGCDIVNVHGGHGWLLGQFMSSLDNHRTDEYGGSIENRDRIPHVPERILSTRLQCARRGAHQGGGQAVQGLCGRRIE